MPSNTPKAKDELDPNAALVAELRRLSTLLEKQVGYQKSWKLPLRNGLLAGFGGVVGATLVVSIIIAAIQPFRNVPSLKPTVDGVERALTHGK